VYNRILDLDAELNRLHTPLASAADPDWLQAKQRLRTAADTALKRPTPWSAWTGADVQRAWDSVHAVEVALIRSSNPVTLAAKLPGLIADAQLVLGPADPQVANLRAYATGAAPLDATATESIAQTVAQMHAVTHGQHAQARSFRNILLATTVTLTLFAAGFALLGALSPTAISLCAPPARPLLAAAPSPPDATCPTARSDPARADIILTELLGVFGASVIGAAAIRKMRGTSTPYAIPLASLLVKIPTGALTATAGLLLLRAGILGPAVAASATPQVLAYALTFGAAQQTVTKLIDQQAQTVLNSIPTRGAGGKPRSDPAGTQTHDTPAQSTATATETTPLNSEPAQQ
jgi:hypothetical protein